MMSKTTMFHISKKLDWKIGEIITCGKEYNPFWIACIDYNPKTALNGEQMSFFELFERCTDIEPTEDNVKHLYTNLKTISKECAFYIREQVFEDVRKMYYPDKPSRQTCLWVSEADQLPYWKTMASNIERTVLTLELNGVLFRGDDYWLKADTLSSIEYAKRAHHYWSGEMSDNPHIEYIFHGNATITNIMNIH